MPTDSDTAFVLGAEDLANPSRCSTEGLDLLDQGQEPAGKRLRRQKPTLRIIIAVTERRDPPLTLILAELEWLQRQCGDSLDEILCDGRWNEVPGVEQSIGKDRLVG